MIGKWHLGTDPTGFDYWEILPGQGSYYNPDFIQMDGTRKRYRSYYADQITDLAIEWMDKQKNSKQAVSSDVPAQSTPSQLVPSSQTLWQISHGFHP